MNRSGIEWCDRTWNPIVGCTEGCEFCYARRQAKRRKPGVRSQAADGSPIFYGCQDCYDFRPHLHPERLGEPQRVKSSRIVFCGSMGDLFDPHVDPEWRQQVWQAMRDAPQHHYVVLTKRPDMIDTSEFRAHRGSMQLWLGVSVTCDRDWWRVYHLVGAWRTTCELHPIISFEPLLGPISRDIPREIEWIIIGAQTGPGARAPEGRWIRDLAVGARDRGRPVFEKDNLEPHHSRRLWQQWPQLMIAQTTGVAARAPGSQRQRANGDGGDVA